MKSKETRSKQKVRKQAGARVYKTLIPTFGR